MVRFDSWRAVSLGNRANRNLATKSTYGGQAIWRAVMGVKSEQAPKAAMRTPTRRETGEAERIGKYPAWERANTITIVHRFGSPG